MFDEGPCGGGFAGGLSDDGQRSMFKNSSIADPAMPRYVMYVLSCADGTLYTGYTVDVEKRVAAHNAGKGAKYTRSRTPVELIACARFETKHEAMSAEYRFKCLTRPQKDRLVRCAAVDPFEEVLRTLMPGECPGDELAENG